jgi:NlpC/P60 family putative phage cell wall peptidase
MTRDDFLDEARSWIGTRWVHQACVKGIGADCIGLIAGVAAALGSTEAARFLRTPEWRNYGRHPLPAFMFGVCDQLMDRIEIDSAIHADVLVFRCGKHPMHFGIITCHATMIHSWLMARRVCEHRIDAAWRSRIERAYRIRGIA